MPHTACCALNQNRVGSCSVCSCSFSSSIDQDTSSISHGYIYIHTHTKVLGFSHHALSH
jgi:hypothetical protein